MKSVCLLIGFVLLLPCLAAAAPVVLFQDDFSTDKGWTGYHVDTLYGYFNFWQRGAATAGGGDASGMPSNPDPGSDTSSGDDNMIVGVNLGNDAFNASETQYLTSPVIDCTGQTHVHLQFQRWLNTFGGAIDDHHLEVYDGDQWVRIFKAYYVLDAQWQSCDYDVSAYAANNAQFRVRFSYYRHNATMGEWSSWNLDDLAVVGLAGAAEPFLDPDFEADNMFMWTAFVEGNNIITRLQEVDDWRSSGDACAFVYTASGNDLQAGDSGGFSQFVDLSQVDWLWFDVNFRQGSHIRAQVSIDGHVVWMRDTPGLYLDQHVNVRGFTGAHSVALQLVVTSDGTAVTSEHVLFDNIRTLPNQLPSAIQPASLSLDENLPAGTVLAELSAVDPDLNDVHTFSLIADTADNALFTLAGAELHSAAAFDHETQPQLLVRVQVADAAGATFQQTLVVNVNDVNEAPVLADLLEVPVPYSVPTVPENSPGSTIVAVFAQHDGDGDLLSYELESDRFELVQAPDGQWQLQVLAFVRLDYETEPSIELLLGLDDGTFADTTTLTVAVADVEPELPVDAALQLELGTGWNMVSLPLASEQILAADLQSSGGAQLYLSVLWTYDAAAAVYERLDDQASVPAGTAFWLFSPGGGSTGWITGLHDAALQPELQVGWNLLAPTLVTTAPQLPAHAGSIWGWNSTLKCYDAVETLYPGRAYWVRQQ